MSDNRDEKPSFPKEESTAQKDPEQQARRQRIIYVVIIFLVAAVVCVATVVGSPTDADFDLSTSLALLLEGSLMILAEAGGFYIAILLYLSIHEMGHILLGALTGFKVRSIQIRRFVFLYHREKWRFKFINFKEFPLLQGVFLGGGSFYTTSDPENLSRRMAIMLAGGPAASTVLMAATIGLLWVYQGRFEPNALIVPMAFTFLFIPTFVIINTIFPGFFNNANSDGYLFRKFLAGDEEATRLAVTHIITTENRIGTHPQAWSYDLLKKAVRIPCLTMSHFELLLMAYIAALSHKDMDLAGEYMNAIQGYLEPANRSLTPTNINPLVYLEIAFYEAFYRDDLENARRWFKDVPEQKEVLQYRTRAEAAILFAEGQFDEAIKKARGVKAELEQETISIGNTLWIIEELDALIAKAREFA